MPSPNINIIAQIARRKLRIPENVACEVKFLARGAFNKVCTIQFSEDTCIQNIMRVSLPVQPHFKTMSETKTIKYIRHHTDIPAPKVWASDLSNKNDLGFGWMIQDFMHGRNLADAWKTISWLKKEVFYATLSATLCSCSVNASTAWATSTPPRIFNSFLQPFWRMRNYLVLSTPLTLVHTVPLYLACQKPKFLDASMDRSVCPDPAN
ncbi:hypothetical protein HBI13_020570 [Parastagonospora nodorum]|nr:hypothetical protein HBI10_097870 [Parastagonospora nodorum]KAH4032138.1 hypothetical protein HBI13_020570 [Parastagonospora nodorum]KAH4801175.1 hypothetical protein HBH61_202010 [Parastagonospora nodorum]KAH4940150.1 hypothetical protein HBI79_039590 [Parastagonospora nodorum]KAH5207908.1 hypothetical protein HBH68_084170 [Parastagonospora nodorum]